MIELAYRFEVDDQTWCEDLAARAADYNPYANASLSCVVQMSEARDSVTPHNVASHGLSKEIEERWISAHDTTENEGADWFYRTGIRTATLSEIDASAGAARQCARWLRRFCNERFPDWFFLVARGNDRCGVVILAPMTETRPLDARTRLSATQLGIHMRNAIRLRQRPGLSGALLKAVEHPASDVATSTLTPATLWKGLCSGKWSLVRKLDRRDVRHYVVYPNPLHEPDPRALTARESTVIELVALGHTNSSVSHILEISSSTVASQLSHAMRKLGINSRRELIWVHRLLTRPSEP